MKGLIQLPLHDGNPTLDALRPVMTLDPDLLNRQLVKGSWCPRRILKSPKRWEPKSVPFSMSLKILGGWDPAVQLCPAARKVGVKSWDQDTVADTWDLGRLNLMTSQRTDSGRDTSFARCP